MIHKAISYIHFKFLSRDSIEFVANFVNSCIIHSYIPEKVLDGVIRPCLKNSRGYCNDSGNYREVMISSDMF